MPSLSSETLSRIEQALPADGPGVPPRRVHAQLGGSKSSIRHGLRMLVQRGRVTADGPDFRKLYRRHEVAA